MDAIGIIKNAKPIYFIFSIIIVFLLFVCEVTFKRRWSCAENQPMRMRIRVRQGVLARRAGDKALV